MSKNIFSIQLTASFKIHLLHDYLNSPETEMHSVCLSMQSANKLTPGIPRGGTAICKGAWGD